MIKSSNLTTSGLQLSALHGVTFLTRHAALRVICRRCSSDQSSEHSLNSNQGRTDEEAPRLKQPSPTVVLQPDNQVNCTDASLTSTIWSFCGGRAP